jgi:hypothetical protein
MSVVMKVFNAMDAKDIVAVEETLHDDFVYFDDYEMRTANSGLKACKTFGRPKTAWMKNAECFVIHAIVMQSSAIASKTE